MAQPTPEHLQYLRDNPDTASQFDEVYGAGASDAILNPQQQQAPQNKPTDAPKDNQDVGFVDTVKDIGVSAADGVMDALENTADFAEEMLPLGGIKIDGDGISYLNPDELKAEQGDRGFYDPNPGEAKTTAGAMTKGVSQFLTDFIGAGKALKAAKWAPGVYKYGRAMVQGATADFLAFNEHEDRLSNLLSEEFPDSIASPIFDYLAADDNDGVVEGRMKQVIEGAIAGGVIDLSLRSARSLMNIVKRTKNARKLKAEGKLQEAEDELAKASDEAEAVAAVESGDATPEQLQLFDNLERQDVPGSTAQSDSLDEVVGRRMPGPVEKHIVLSADEIKYISDAVQNGDSDGALEHIRFHTDTWTDKDPLLAVDALFKIAKEKMPSELNDTLTFNMTERGAKTLAKSPEDLMRQYSKVAQFAVEDLPKFHWAADMVKRQLWTQVAEKARMVDLDDEAAIAELDKLFDLASNLEVDFGLVNRGTGRTLNVNQAVKQATGSSMDAGAIDHALRLSDEMKGDRKGFYKRVGKLADKPKKLRYFLDKTLAGKTWDVHNELWINSILSGVKTHMVNIGSATMETLINPLEKGLSSTIRGDFKAAKGDVVGHYMGVYKGMRDTITLFRESMKEGAELSSQAANSPGAMAAKTFSQEGNILDPFHTLVEGHQGIASNPAAIKFTKPVKMADGTTRVVQDDSGYKGIVNSVGKVLRIPTRLLAAEDEFFKQINYRANMTAQGYKEGMRLGLKGKQLSSFAEDFVEKHAFDANGKAANADALQYAREVTFTQDLEYGLGRQVQKAVNSYPAFRAIAPFVRAPTNLIRHTFKRFPILGLIQKEHREILLGHGTPQQYSDLIARQTVGTAMLGTAVYMVNAGMIEGGAPKDPDLRREFEDAGKLEYSFKVGDKSYQFSRLDPRFMVFGLVADYVRIQSELGEDDESAAELAMAMSTAMSSQLTNKLYFKGIADVIDAVSSEDPEVMRKFWIRRAGSYIPSAIAQFADNESKELRDVTDGIMARIPGLSGEVEAKRNILGKKRMKPSAWGPDLLSPIAMKDGLTEPAMKAIEPLQHGFGLPRKKIGQLDLTEYRNSKTGQSAYDRWQELTGELTVGGKTLTDRLNDLVESDLWERMPEQSDLPEGVESYRVKLVNRELDRYRKRAFKEMLRESPYKKLAENIKIQKKNTKRGARRGPSVLQPLLQ